MSPLSFAVLAYSLVATPEVSPRAVPLEPWARAVLSKDDRKLLDSLLKDLLFDPKGAVRVSFEVPAHQVPAAFILPDRNLNRSVTTEGWLVKGKNGQSDRIFFFDGDSIPVPAGKITHLDYALESLKLFPLEHRFNAFRIQLDEALEIVENHLMRAAWLHRLGFDNLAAYVLKSRPTGDAEKEIRKNFREVFARRAFSLMLLAHCARADADAVRHGERLLRLYPIIARDECFQVDPILADLKRRKAAGTFGKAPGKNCPNGFDTWPVPRRIEYLIAALDEVDGTPREVFSHSRFGGPSFANDWRYEALVELGDAAIPALIGVIENDERLTRYPGIDHLEDVKYQRAPLLGVRDIAEQIVWQTLRAEEFSPRRSKGENAAPPALHAARIRKYWKSYGHLPFVERMMTILTDRAAKPEVRREAAGNLAAENTRFYSTDRYRSQAWYRDREERPAPGPQLTPLVLKFQSPTIAEAILAAMNDGSEEDAYVEYLAELGDYRIVGELVRRSAKAQTIWQRLRYAQACRRLGSDSPRIQIARELTTGTIWWSRGPSDENPSVTANEGLDLVLSELNGSTLPDANVALFAVSDIHHPCYPMVVHRVLDGQQGRFISNWLSNHALCLEVLRKCLKNQELTGTQFFLRGNEIQSLSPDGKSNKSPVGNQPSNPEVWLERADERLSDRAAEAIANRCFGIPLSSPLRRDREQVHHLIDGMIVRYTPRWRELGFDETMRFRGWPRQYGRLGDRVLFYCGTGHSPPPLAIPDIKPLKRPGTAADVRSGHAIFELGGKGKVAEQKLPAWLLLKSDAKQNAPPFGLVVQAELGPDGKIIYGVIFQNKLRAVKADEVERIEAIEKR